MTPLQVKLDWFSFTFPLSGMGEKDNEFALSTVLLAFHDHTAHRFLGVVTQSLWQFAPISGFYSTKIQCPTTGLSISWKAGNGFALVECSGQVVDKLLSQIGISDLARAANGRATRIDLAVDMETEVSPEEFALERGEDRFKSSGVFISPTGTTVYVGSRRGERMARVYRYTPPHPRAHLLRAEVELKGEAARIACDALTNMSLTEVALSAHLPFSWKHKVWDTGEVMVSKLPARKYDHEGAGTLKWIHDIVFPSLKKAHADGLLNVWQELADYLSEIPF